jgi:hypothetical protein
VLDRERQRRERGRAILCNSDGWELGVATTQLLIRLPEALVARFKRNVSVRQRSRFIECLLEQALPPADAGDDDPLYQAAIAAENMHGLSAEMAEWEVAAIDDGLGDAQSRTRGR